MPDTAMDARVLGQLLLMQSVMTNLPDEEAILAFVCRGLKDIPGVVAAAHEPSSRETPWRSCVRQDDGEPSLRLFPLRAGQSEHGALTLTVKSEELLEPYVAYLNNFCFMLAVILEERRQRRLIESHKAWLEERVEERTAELKAQSTKREAAETSLLESEERFRLLVELAPEAILVFRPDSVLPIMANRKAEELFACPRQELMGLGHFRFFSEDQPDGRPSAETIREYRDRALAGEETVFELAIRNGRGEDLLCEVRLVRLPSQGEWLLRASWVDITDRKKLEDALRQSEERYRAMEDASLSGFWVVDERGAIKDANAAYARMSGYSREELQGMPISRVEAQETPQDILAHVKLIMEGGGDRFETRHRAKDGRLLDVEVSAILVPERHEIMAFMNDITARKRAEAVLKSRLDLAIRGETLDLDGLLQAALDEAERLTGSSIGFFHFIDEDQRHATLQAWSARTLALCDASAKGTHYPIAKAGVWVECLESKATVLHNDYESLPGRKGYPEGHVRLVRELVAPIYREGLAVAIMGVGNKETDYTPLDAELVEQLATLCWEVASRKIAEEKLRRSLEEKTVLLKEVHHRVKNNLQILMSLIDLQAGTLSGEDSAQAFRLVQNRVRAIALAHERLYRSPDLGAVQLREYITDLVRHVGASHPNAQGVLARVEVEDVTLGVDRAIPIGLLVTELVTNAYKHAFSGREGGELYVGMACEGDNCLLTVADDGPGLPGSFGQAEGASLGMELVRALAGQLKGTLAVRPGLGARIELSFPFRPGEAGRQKEAFPPVT